MKKRNASFENPFSRANKKKQKSDKRRLNLIITRYTKNIVKFNDQSKYFRL